MSDIKFEWNKEKARANKRKHGISFNEALFVFADPLSITRPDPDHSETESRFITIGNSQKNQLLMVCHADREDRIRIISARKVTKNEKRKYEEKS